MAYLDLGLQEEALQALAVSLEIAQRLRDPSLLFWTYNRIGNAHGHLGNHLESRAFLRRALPFATGLCAEAKFCTLNNLADNGADLAFFAREQTDTALLADAVETGLYYARDALELARAATIPIARRSASAISPGCWPCRVMRPVPAPGIAPSPPGSHGGQLQSECHRGELTCGAPCLNKPEHF